MTATDPTNIPDPGEPQGPGDRITTPQAHNHDGELKVWCETCQHTHIVSIPEVTYACHRCGFGSWHSETATEHESLCHGHETYPLGHVMRPAAPAHHHGSAGFCTDHGQDADRPSTDALLGALPGLRYENDGRDRPTTVAEAVEVACRAHLEARKGAPLAPGEFEATRSRVETKWMSAVLEAVGYADLLAEVARLRGSADAWWTEYDKALTEGETLHAALEASLASRDALAATVARVEALRVPFDAVPALRRRSAAAWVAGYEAALRETRAVIHPEKGTDDE